MYVFWGEFFGPPSQSGGGVYLGSGTFHLIGCTFSGNGADSYGDDIDQITGTTLEFYSFCPGSTAYAGTGTLDCSGCSGPADLSNTSSCVACTAPTPFACCGATACSASASNCSATEADICPGPTLTPTPQPTLNRQPSPVPTPVPTLYCGAGSFLNEANGACSLCLVGKYSNTIQAPFSAQCRVCAAGKFANQQGSSECRSCATGKLSSPDRSFCQDCSAGEYVKYFEECYPCESGRYAPQPLTGACLACAAGSYTNNATKATTCSPCDAGSFSTVETAVKCALCYAGSVSTSSQSSCTLCEPGKYVHSNGSSTCVACAAGTAVAIEGATSCIECTAGQFQSRSSEPSCELCAGGKISSESASTACSTCPLGQVASRKGASSCQSCRAGEFQDAPGQSLCKQCAAGSFSSLEGSASCVDCRGDLYSTATATECTLCRRLFFYTLEGRCAECPEGVDCSLHGGATQELLALKPGYWRISPLAAEVYPCLLTLACKGGVDFDTTTRSRNLRADAQGSDSYCNKGYTGPLCSTCVRNGGKAYFLGTGTESEVKECLPCGDTKTFVTIITTPRVIMLLVALFLVVGLLVASYIKFKPSTKAKQQQKKLTDQLARENDTATENEDGSKTFTKVFELVPLSSVKRTVCIKSSAEAIITQVTTTRVSGETAISRETMVRESNVIQAMFQIMKRSKVQLKAFVAFFQIVGNIGFNYSFTWPAYFEAIVDEFAVFNIDVMSVLGLNCVTTRFDYIDTMLVTTLFPLGLAAPLFVSYLFANLQQRSRRKKRAEQGANCELTDELRAKFTNRDIVNFQEVFATYDKAGSGEIELFELTMILKDVFSNVSEAEAEQRARDMIAAADLDGNGSISFSEFVTAMHNARHQGQASAFAELVDKVEAKVTKVAGQATFYSFLTLTFIVLVGTSSKLFNYFKCRSFPEAEGGEESYLSKDYSIDCDSPRYKAYLAYAGLMLLIYPVGIPLLYTGLLYEHRDVLGNNEAMDREAANGFPTTGHLLFLIEAYKPEYLYFEVVECGRRLLLAAVIGIVAADSAASPAIGLCICLSFVYVFTTHQPYKNSLTNFMGVVLAFSLTFFFLAALMIKADLSSDDKSDQKTYGFVLIAVLFVGPTTLVFHFVKTDVFPTWKRLCADNEAVDEELIEREAETQQDATETGVFDERAADAPSGSQVGIRDHGDNGSTHEAPLLSSMDDLARAYSGGGGHFELLKLPRSPHAAAGRRYMMADDNDAAISDDDSTETKSLEQEQQQQLHRPGSSGTSSLHRDHLNIGSAVSLDIMPPSTLLSSLSTKKQQFSATRGSNKSAVAVAAAAPGLTAHGMGKSPGVSRRSRSDGNKTKGTAEKVTEIIV